MDIHEHYIKYFVYSFVRDKVVLVEGESKEKKEEGEEKGELGDPASLSLDDPDRSSPSLAECRR